MFREALLVFGSLIAAAQSESAFLSQVQELQKAHQAVLDSCQRLGDEGKVREANDRLLTLIPEKDRGAAQCFWLANLLYDVDPLASRDLHRKALEKAPRLKLVAYELALEEHRAGRHAEAAKLYEQSLDGQTTNPGFALLADCRLRLGDLKGAVQAWRNARHAENHVAIDFAIHSVYGKLSPFRRRSDLLETIRQGGKDQFPALLKLDLEWDTDWWNTKVNAEALKADLTRAEAAFGTADPLFKELKAYAALKTLPEMGPDHLRPVLKEQGWILDGGGLPRNPMIASELIGWTLQTNLASAQDMLKRFEGDLDRRVDAGDVEALNALSALSLRAELPIDAYDLKGWRMAQDKRFAESFLLGKEEHLKLADPDLQRALRQFPDDALISLLAVQCAGREKSPMKAPLIQLIEAEYTGLRTDPNRFSYALKSYFAALESTL